MQATRPTAILTISPSRYVHDINVKSKNGRTFVIDIFEAGVGQYDSTVTALDPVSAPFNSSVYKVTPASPAALENFKASVELVLDYLGSMPDADAIADVHNPCNCPFASEVDQNKVLASLGINLHVRVN